MNCRVKWIEQEREGFFYSCHTDKHLELPLIDAYQFAEEEQRIGNKWRRKTTYQVVDSDGMVVYDTKLAQVGL